MATRMQQRRGTAAQWISTNNGDGPILEVGEIGFETDTGKFKMGDGINHWVDLDYFLDESEIDSITGDYVLASTLGQINGVATLNELGKITSSQIPNIDELAQDAVDSALVAGIGLEKTYNDNANTITLDIDSTVATKSFAAGLLTGATKTNITITGDENGLTISAENGVADSTTDNLSEGSTNKYFTDERAQDAVGNALGTGLSYNDSTGAISVTTNTYDSYGSASAVAGDLSSHESDTTTHGVAGNIVGTSDTQVLTNKTISHSDNTITVQVANVSDLTATAAELNTLDGITATTAELNILDGVTATAEEINYIDGVTSSVQSQLDDKLSKAGGTMTGDITLAGAPTQALHAATKAYVDGIAEGLHIHASCVAATTGNVAIATDLEPGDIVDGVTLAEGDRILVKSQTNAAQNGIYVVQASGAALRAADFNEPQEVDGGDFVFVTGGNTHDNTGWVQTTTNIVTIGTDPIQFTQFSGAGTYLAGTGLDLTDNVFSIDTATTVDVSTAQTLTNKTISAANNTLTIATTDLQDVTASAVELNILDGATLSTAELNILDGVTATAAEINVLDGITASTAELNYVDGVTSAIQTQIDGKISSSSSDTLTNKTVNLSGNTVSGTIAQFNTALSDADFATLEGTETLTNKVIDEPILVSPEERWTRVVSGASGTINFNAKTTGILYYILDSTANWTLNIRGDADTTLNSMLAVMDSITVVFFATNGLTPYYQTGFQIDGSTSVNLKWQNGTVPSAGNASSVDVYSYTIVKTANATFTAFGSQTKFA